MALAMMALLSALEEVTDDIPPTSVILTKPSDSTWRTVDDATFPPLPGRA